MERVQVDKGLGDKLLALKKEVVLCDEQGRVLGYFSPVEPPMSLEEIARTAPRSMEEIEEQMKKYAGKRPEEVGKPLRQILSRLGLHEPPRSIDETEELRKRGRENKGRPLAEILKELGH